MALSRLKNAARITGLGVLFITGILGSILLVTLLMEC